MTRGLSTFLNSPLVYLPLGFVNVLAGKVYPFRFGICRFLGGFWFELAFLATYFPGKLFLMGEGSLLNTLRPAHIYIFYCPARANKTQKRGRALKSTERERAASKNENGRSPGRRKSVRKGKRRHGKPLGRKSSRLHRGFRGGGEGNSGL